MVHLKGDPGKFVALIGPPCPLGEVARAGRDGEDRGALKGNVAFADKVGDMRALVARCWFASQRRTRGKYDKKSVLKENYLKKFPRARIRSHTTAIND